MQISLATNLFSKNYFEIELVVFTPTRERTWKDFGTLPIEASIRLVVHQSKANLTFLLDFVSLKKRIMSEECWFFTLEMTPQALGTRDFPYR